MIGFNHAASGALIGRLLPLPLAIPVALASHFVLDALPHFGIDHKKRDKSWFWKVFTVFDFFVAWSLAIVCVSIGRYDMLLCGLIAASPDFVWVTKILKHQSFDVSKTTNRFNKWHIKIQHEYPWGLLAELPLAAVFFYASFIMA